MKELLKKLLEADILSEDTKTELETAINTHLEEAVEVAKKEASAETKAALSEQWVTEKETLIEAIDTKVEDFLAEEVSQLKGDIERFRDLEAEKAQELVEAKEQMSDNLRDDLAQLVEKLDSFLEIRINAELEELKEDIAEEKQKEFGRRMFEAFHDEFSFNFSDEESVQAKLNEAESRLEAVTTQLQESEVVADRYQRNAKMKALLEPLSGRQKDIMETVLVNVPTEDLEEGYKTFVGRVLKETHTSISEKEESVLQEGATSVSTENDIPSTAKLASGDVITESDSSQSKEQKAELSESMSWVKTLAGLNE